MVPDVRSFAACGSACEKSHRWALALEVLGRQRRQGLGLGSHMATAVIASCGHAAKWLEALAVYEQLHMGGVGM